MNEEAEEADIMEKDDAEDEESADEDCLITDK